MKHILTAGLMTATLSLGFAQVSYADEASENATVETRQMLMEGIAGAMASIGCYMKGSCELSDSDLRHLAKGVAFSAHVAPGVFEPKTPAATHKTTAKDDIWNDWADFSGRFPELEAAALKLASAAGDKGAMGAALGEVGKTCKGCHDNYRTK